MTIFQRRDSLKREPELSNKQDKKDEMKVFTRTNARLLAGDAGYCAA
jgi:hypothetical protein